MAGTGTAIVDFSTGMTEASVSVSGLAAILATSQAGCALRSEATALNSVDDIYIDPIDVEVINLIAGVGFFILARARNGLNFGTYKVDWAWV